VFKTHVDIFDKWDASIAERLTELAKKHGGCVAEEGGRGVGYNGEKRSGL
jgi:hypothetical protein